MFGVSQSVISRIYIHYRDTGAVQERLGRGRKRSTSAQDDRYVRMYALRQCDVNASQLQIRLRDIRGAGYHDKLSETDYISMGYVPDDLLRRGITHQGYCGHVTT